MSSKFPTVAWIAVLFLTGCQSGRIGAVPSPTKTSTGYQLIPRPNSSYVPGQIVTPDFTIKHAQRSQYWDVIPGTPATTVTFAADDKEQLNAMLNLSGVSTSKLGAQEWKTVASHLANQSVTITFSGHPETKQLVLEQVNQCPRGVFIRADYGSDLDEAVAEKHSVELLASVVYAEKFTIKSGISNAVAAELNKILNVTIDWSGNSTYDVAGANGSAVAVAAEFAPALKLEPLPKKAELTTTETTVPGQLSFGWVNHGLAMNNGTANKGAYVVSAGATIKEANDSGRRYVRLEAWAEIKNPGEGGPASGNASRDLVELKPGEIWALVNPGAASWSFGKSTGNFAGAMEYNDIGHPLVSTFEFIWGKQGWINFRPAKVIVYQCK
jgi:hypothetical protein